MIYLMAILEKFITNGLRASSVLWFLNLFDGANKSQAIEWAASLGAWIYLMPFFAQKAFDFLSLRAKMRLGNVFLCMLLICIWYPVDSGLNGSIFKLGCFFAVLGTSFYRNILPIIFSREISNKGLNQVKEFSRFYTAMNIGSFFGVLFIAVFGEIWGWQNSKIGLTIAAFLLAILTEFNTFTAVQSQQNDHVIKFGLKNLFILMSMIAFLLTPSHLALWMNLIAGYLIFVFWRNKKWEFLLWVMIHGVFWVFYDQAGTTFVLISDQGMDRTLGMFSGLHIPNTAFLLIDPFLNITLASFVLFLFNKLFNDGLNIKRLTFASGMLILLFGVFLFQYTNKYLYPVPVVEFVFMHFLFVVAEQLAVPTGLAYASSVQGKIEDSVSLWLFGIAYFTWVSGCMGKFLIERLMI